MTDSNRTKSTLIKIALKVSGREEDLARIEINKWELLELLSNPHQRAILIREDHNDSEEEREISESQD